MKRFVAGVGSDQGRDRVRTRGFRRVLVPTRRLPLHREDGQALVEFALVLIPLLLILFGTLELGRAWNNKNDVVHLANEAVRLAAVNCDPSTVVQNEANVDGLPKPVTLAITGGATVGSAVTATVHVPFTSGLIKLVPGLSSLISKGLTGTASMRAEQAYTGSACP